MLYWFVPSLVFFWGAMRLKIRGCMSVYAPKI